MRIAVFGTGTVGQTIATRLLGLGHQVWLGSRTATNEKALAWQAQGGVNAKVATFAEAARAAELVFNCTKGEGTVPAFESVQPGSLEGKTVIDVSNPLVPQKGQPPGLFVALTDSLAEQLQRAAPSAKVVKALNTVNCKIMVNPRALPETHHVFVCGDDAQAKAQAVALLKTFGWQADELLDLGPLANARGPEAYLALWVRLYGAVKTADFNVKLVKA